MFDSGRRESVEISRLRESKPARRFLCRISRLLSKIHGFMALISVLIEPFIPHVLRLPLLICIGIEASNLNICLIFKYTSLIYPTTASTYFAHLLLTKTS